MITKNDELMNEIVDLEEEIEKWKYKESQWAYLTDQVRDQQIMIVKTCALVDMLKHRLKKAMKAKS